MTLQRETAKLQRQTLQKLENCSDSPVVSVMSHFSCVLRIVTLGFDEICFVKRNRF